MNKKTILRALPAVMLLFAAGAMTAYANEESVTYRSIDGTSYTYNSQGILTVTNEEDNSQSIVIDTSDIYANEEAIVELRDALTGLGGGTLSYDEATNIYYIDIDGDGALNKKVDVLIGAVGTVTSEYVLEGYTFSSQEQGVNEAGTMKNVGYLTDEMMNSDDWIVGYYTGSKVTKPTEATGKTYLGSNTYLTGTTPVTKEEPVSLSKYKTDSGYELTVGVNEAVTFPSGYYSKPITVDNGVKYIGTVKDSMMTGTWEAGYYDGNEVTIPTKASGAPYTGGNTYLTGSNPVTEKETVNLSKYKTDSGYELTVGVNEAVTLPSGYYSTPITVDNGVKDNGNVVVNFSKASLTATLGAGYYQSITFNTKQAYVDGYVVGKAQTSTQNVYNTIVVVSGSNGTFSDGTSGTKTYTGPSYSGMDLNITPKTGYIFDKWEITASSAKLTMTATYKQAQLKTETYELFLSGEQNSDLKVTQISFTLSSSVEQWFYSNSYDLATVDFAYDIYVNDELIDTVTISSTGAVDSMRENDAGAQVVTSHTSASKTYTLEKASSNVKIVCTKANYTGIVTATMTVKGY